jgi:hypothetical protein
MKKVEIYRNTQKMGTSVFSDEEAKHFSCASICTARVALTAYEIQQMGLNEDDEINIVVNEDVT